MIISRTPFRISFFGGGTDYPAWFRKHGGAVLATTIDKYGYITCRYLPPFHEHRISIVYSKMENCNAIDEIKHPAAREVLRFLSLDRGVEIHHDADLPARSGMGSSSSFTVGLLYAIHALQGRMVGKKQLAAEAIHLEQDVLKEAVGSQDQVLAAYGGFNHITFSANGDMSVRPITLPPARIESLNCHLMLFYTGIKRTASNIAEKVIADMDDCKRQLRLMKDLVDEGISILSGDQEISAFGNLLHEAWQAKRSLNAAVSNDEIDSIYQRARTAGAIGGKITGAGGGGFLLLFVEPEKQERVKAEFSDLIHVPFKFEHSGSQIIFCEQEQDYSAAEQSRNGKLLREFRELVL
jgi:D-glycero-alpha-D-manno-heptose-7-phosphate kinase